MGGDRGVRLRVEADHESFLLQLVPAIAIDFELDVGDAVPKVDQSIPVLGAIQLWKNVHNLLTKSIACFV